MASVASELSAVHHAHAGLGLRGNSQAASQQDSASSFDSLLDGADSSPPPPASAPRPAPPTSSAPPPAQQSAPEESADKPGQTPAADATQTPPEPTDVSAGAQAGVPTGSDDRKGSGSVAAAALGPPAPITGKAGQPFIAAILDAAAPSDDAQAVGPIVPADPNGSVVAASEAASQDDLNATTGLPDRHDGKSGKSDGPDSAQAAAVPGDDSALTPIVVPVPQPVAFAVSAPTGAEGDDDGGEIARLAAAGEAARPSRPGAQTAGADAASADAAPSAPNDAGEEDGGPAPTQSPSVPGPNARIRSGRADAGSPQPASNAFANLAVERDAGRNIHPHDAFRAAGDAAMAGPDREAPASPIADPSQQAGATQHLDTASTAAGDSRPPDHNPPASPPPDVAGSAFQPDNLAATAGAAAPPVSPAPADQAAVPATTAAPPAVPIAGLAVEIAARARAGTNRFDIRLDPPDLGRIDVRLDVAHDGKVTSHLVVERQETLDVLRRDASEIERSLHQAGLKTADDGLQFTLRDQSFGQQNPYPRHEPLPGGARIVVPDPELPAIDALKDRYGGIAGLGGGIDIRV